EDYEDGAASLQAVASFGRSRGGLTSPPDHHGGSLMCGIAGIVRFDRPAQTQVSRLRALQARLRHRGPDGAGLHLASFAALAHTRLALIALAPRPRRQGGPPVDRLSQTLTRQPAVPP